MKRSSAAFEQNWSRSHGYENEWEETHNWTQDDKARKRSAREIRRA